ncbi:MAG: hypothetical protein EA001_03820 [Oscillatoriales cyanobacterium]|nr:MAG: hypothetical protein EA001_03820 [Oscillatoriales cyanobacterium]
MSDLICLIRSIAAVSATAIVGWGAIAQAETTLDRPTLGGWAAQRPVTSAEPWFGKIVGRYPGQIFNGDSPVPGTTEFTQGRDGQIAGRYEMIESTGPALGTITNCQALADRTLRCTWQDKYGEGLFEATFAEDFNSFEGFWRTPDSLQRFVWNGARVTGDR